MKNFENNIDPKIRRESGIHYTNVNLIHKVIDPLFLNQLQLEFNQCKSTDEFQALHEKISSLIFFDPACGSGNFLVEIYKSLYDLETQIINHLHTDRKLSVKNFYGIELNDFSCSVARVSLMLVSGQKIVPNIFHGNALQIDWKKILPQTDIYIVGNPPFVGYSLQTAEQKSDIQMIFKGWHSAGKMDYVSCWFKKSAEFITNSKSEVSFVATSSICQGESVGLLWKKLFDDGIRINFAYRSFKWFNNDENSAHVYCVVVGFAAFNRVEKFIDDEKVHNINAYLLNGENIFVETRLTPVANVPKMIKGNQPTDDGNLIITENQLEKFTDPQLNHYIRPLIGANELIHGKNRYCFWLIDAPKKILELPLIKQRIEAIEKFRLSSHKKATQESAKIPWLFQEIRQPTSNYIAVPRVSTNVRKYLPIEFYTSETIATDAVLIIPAGNEFLFGVLSSSVHMIWLKTICGRLGNGVRYSINIVYNNFPFPAYNDEIESTAKKIIEIRAKYSESLAKLYKNIPKDLESAHLKNDQAVLKSYGFENLSDNQIAVELLKLYQFLKGDI